MVKKILFLITKEVTGLHQAAYVLGFFTFLSQLLGLVRDRLLAYTFGADQALDIYYAAFRIPDLVLTFAASIVSIAILVPLLTKHLKNGKEAGKEFIDDIFTVFFGLVVLANAVLFVLAPYLVPVVFPGFDDPATIDQLVRLMRILLLSPVFLGLSNLFASVVQVYKRFFLYALSPLLYNAGIIFGIIILYPAMGLDGLAVGVIIGAVMHLGIQTPLVIQKGFVPSFSRSIDWQRIRSVFSNSIPRSITLSMNQLAILALISLASLFTAGSITVFNFSWNLQSVPLAIVGASYSLAAFPTLSRLFSDGEMERFMAQMQTALRHIIFWSIPALVLFIVLRAQIVRTVLGAGEFGWAATRLTAGSLALFAFSVLAQSVILLLVRGYYAAGNTVKPLITNVIGGVLIIGFAIGLTYLFNTVPEFAYFIEALFRVEHLSGTVVLMLPLAFSLGTFVNAGLLYWLFQRDIGSFSDDLYRTTFYIIGASIIMGFATYHLLGVMVTVFDTSTVVGIFLQGLTAGLGGILVCILVLWSLGSRELAEMYAALKERYWRIDVSGIDETSGTPH